jgi:light-regulated signal transduction histidine kinase (bacteriophytochrome)
VLSRALSVRRLRLENASLQRNLKERNAILEATNHELDAFASSVSHDLQAPVRHIRAYGKLLLEEGGSLLPQSSREYLSQMIGAAERLGQLIGDLLDFSRTAQQEFRSTDVDLNQIAATAQARLEPEVQGRQIHWRIATLPMVRGDASLLEQVYYNLFSNAIKYTGRRTVAEIETGWYLEDEVLPVFFVKDNGVGFDMAYGEKLFEMFQRLHADTEFKGSGVGLANVRRIISRHRGRTWAEGQIDKGACFYFTLPK